MIIFGELSLSYSYVGVAKWMDWMDMDLNPNGWIKKIH